MKVFIGLSLLVALALAEPVDFRRQYYLAQVKEQQAEAPYPPSGFKPAGPAFEYPQKQNGAEKQYLPPNAPTTPQRQYGAPAAVPQQNYGAPVAPQQQYGAPAAPQQQYGAPAAPEQKYGAPAAPQQQYGAPTAPQQQYGAPSVPQRQYGAPQEATTTEFPYTTEAEEATTTVPTEFESEPVTSVNELDDEESLGTEQQRQTGQYYIALPDGRLQRVQYVSRQDVEAMKYYAKIRAENVEPLRGPIYAYSPLQKIQVVPGGIQLAVAPASPITAAAPVTSENFNVAPAKLEIEPITQIQYQYDRPSEVIPLANSALSEPYTSLNGKYQLPAGESRFLLTYQ